MQWQLRAMDVMIWVMDAEKDKKVKPRYESMARVMMSLNPLRHTRCVSLVLRDGRFYQRRPRSLSITRCTSTIGTGASIAWQAR